LSEREEVRVLRGVVYMMKSRGPRTEPRSFAAPDFLKMGINT